MPTPLLQTKLYIPHVRPETVLRPRLLERLDEGLRLGRKLTLVSAPAGFGKTTLLSEWIHSGVSSREYGVGEEHEPAGEVSLTPYSLLPTPLSPLPTPCFAWVSLDEGDNDPARFLAYFVAALQTLALRCPPSMSRGRVEGIEPGIGAGALSALQSPQPPPTESVLTALINEIAALPDRIVLVLDDYHLIEAQPIHEALTFLLEHLPPQMHLVVATREDPHLPLARLRARGHLTELRATDLRFSSSEAAEFLNQVMGLDLSAEDIAALETRTEGWIAGLQLAAISMQGHKDVSGFIRSFTGSHRFVLDYLIEDVLEQQSESVQTFLLQTAILDRLTGSLCDAVRFGPAKSPSSSEGTAVRFGIAETPQFGEAKSPTGQDNGQATLEKLERANLFIVPLDEERRWYRYHPLFSDLLRQRLRQNPPPLSSPPLGGTEGGIVAELHIRASEWCEQNGFTGEAVEYALRAEDFERAADLIEKSVDAIWQNGGHTKLRRWLAGLPLELVFSRPHLCIFHAWGLFVSGQHDAAEQSLQAAEQTPSTCSDRAIETSALEQDQRLDSEVNKIQGRVAAFRAFMATYHGDTSRMLQYSRQALENLSEQESSWRIIASIALADAHLYKGEYTAAYRARLGALETSNATGNTYLIITSSLRLATSLREQGRLQRVREICQQQLQLANESGLSQSGSAGWLLAIWGEVLAEMSDLDEALDKATKGVEFAERGGDVAILGLSNLCLVRVLFSRGDIAGADKIIQKMENIARQYVVPPWMTSNMAAWQAWIWLAQDRLSAASQWVLERELDIDREPTYLNEFEYRVLARILIAQGQLEDATMLLQRLLEVAETGDRTTNAIEILILQALSLQTQGDTDQAITTLEKALALAEPEGFFRVFVDEGPPMARLLYGAAIRGIAPDYARRLLAAFPVAEPQQTDPSKTQAPQSELVEPLSERELEVLQLIAAGLTNQEIASGLFLALNTVKAHTRNIYGKLGVTSRTQAVARARVLGILPST